MMSAKELELNLSDSLQREDILKEKLAESKRELRAADAIIENLQMQVEKLAAENAYLIPKAASELSNAWGLHKYLIGIQAAIMYLDNGNKKSAQEWLYGTIAGPGFEFPDEVEDIDTWATHQMRGSISHPQAIEIIKAETPATDAFLAEVRAQGVEMLAEKLRENIAVDSSGSTRARALTRIVDRASDQIRKGVQS